tara:strand:- start:3966 stop:4370 length:405 start_codon:yes stop_codon:yes gene_type:complete
MSKLEGISVGLPLAYSNQDGPYKLNKTILEAIKQNFKNLILTSPGERVMIPEFGVGIYAFLFENINDETFNRVAEKIAEQTSIYLPVINLESVDFVTSDEDLTIGGNEVGVVIKYNILPYNGSDELKITVSNTI